MSGQPGLFEIPPEYRPEKRSNTPKWGGRKSTAARAKCRAMLPHPCRKCGGIITPEDPESSWDAGHETDRAAGGGHTGIEPEHSRCNRSAGGKAGAAITNSKWAKPTMERVQVPQWW